MLRKLIPTHNQFSVQFFIDNHIPFCHTGSALLHEHFYGCEYLVQGRLEGVTEYDREAFISRKHGGSSERLLSMFEERVQSFFNKL